MGTNAVIDTLRVPGATLHYEVRGSGPVLLMIPGGPMDAGGFEAIAGTLADRYTVVTYDPRGHARSPLEGSPDDLTVEIHADDAARLLAAVGTEPAFVLGSSGGATYGLDLAARHAGRVRTLIAHEPPVGELLPDAAKWHALCLEVRDTYLRDGMGPAMQLFEEGTGMGGGAQQEGPPPTPEMAEFMQRIGANMDLFMRVLVPIVGTFVPDIEALSNTSTRIVVGVGDASTEEQLPYRASHALAERLGVTPERFPGDHGGFGSHPAEFAEKLHEILGA
jgi:pimeloyl-ACP methyl ester carboxylesterase